VPWPGLVVAVGFVVAEGDGLTVDEAVVFGAFLAGTAWVAAAWWGTGTALGKLLVDDPQAAKDSASARVVVTSA